MSAPPVHRPLPPSSSTGIFKNTVRHDGIRGLYRGLGPTILGYLPTWAIYFAVYDGIKRRFGEPPLADGSKPRRIYPAPQPKGYQPVMREHPWTLHILSAMIAGAVSTTCTMPLWVIKTRFMVRTFVFARPMSCDTTPMQTQSRREVRYRHTFDAAWTIYETEGIRAFYRGLLPSLFGITHVAVQFPLYEQLKRWAREHTFPSRADSTRLTFASEGNSDVPLPSHVILLCSAIAKMTASITTYPHEVIRTRLQTLRLPIAEDMSSDGMIKLHDRRSVIYITRKIIEKEGWTGLYKGLSVNLFRTVPNSAVTLLT